jgi:transposase
MNRKGNDIRKLYKKLKQEGREQKEICSIIGISEVTTCVWNKIPDDLFLTEPNKSTRKPSIDLNQLKELNCDNPMATNEELGKILNCSKNIVQKYRQKLGFKRKVTTKTYLESDEELKKIFKRA